MTPNEIGRQTGLGGNLYTLWFGDFASLRPASDGVFHILVGNR